MPKTVVYVLELKIPPLLGEVCPVDPSVVEDNIALALGGSPERPPDLNETEYGLLDF